MNYSEVRKTSVEVEDANDDIQIMQILHKAPGRWSLLSHRRTSLILLFMTLVLVSIATVVGYVAVSRHGEDDVALRWKASNHDIPGLTFSDEWKWEGPFFFVFGADTQFGLIDYMNNITVDPSWDEELRRLNFVIDRMNAMNPKPKFFIICGDLVNAWPEKFPDRRQRQEKDLKRALLRLDASIPAICVCGNHDTGQQPSNNTIAKYRGSFGDDYFSFWIQGSLFIVLNSQYYKDDSLVPDLSAQQESWLDTILNSTYTPRHTVVFLHIPPFKNNIDEPEEWFNMAIEKRKPLLNKLFNAGVRKVFCGHFHRNGGGFAFERRLEVIVNSAIGRVWAGKPGIRIVRMEEEDVKHVWFDMDDIPLNVEL